MGVIGDVRSVTHSVSWSVWACACHSLTSCMSKFRNVIVHDYARVDPTIVVQILREHLADFTRFKAAALKWI